MPACEYNSFSAPASEPVVRAPANPKSRSSKLQKFLLLPIKHVKTCPGYLYYLCIRHHLYVDKQSRFKMLNAYLKKYGKIRTTIAITTLVCTLSGSITCVVLAIFQGYIDLLGILLSVGLPLSVTPIITLKFCALLDRLEAKNQELIAAQKELKILSGLIPICATCKKIRDDKGYWNQLEAYIQKHSEATFTHGLCDECMEKIYKAYKQ